MRFRELSVMISLIGLIALLIISSYVRSSRVEKLLRQEKISLNNTIPKT
jgi:hypothetical protein